MTITRLARRSRVALAGLAAGLAVLTVTAPAVQADPGPKPAALPDFLLSGTGEGTLDILGAGWKGHKVRFAIEAKGFATESQGTFRVQHWFPDGKVFADFQGKIDCLNVGGDVAVVTGVIEKVSASPAEIEIPTGKRVGFTVDDEGKRDRLGWSWAVLGFEQELPICMGTAPILPLSKGGYTVRD
ncbi:hypothetical protein ACWENQ_08670 [Nonomuraea sp. NPDC004354]